MRSKAILGLVSFVMISACGKNMQLTVQPQAAKANAAKAAKAAQNTLNKTNQSAGSAALNDGKLTALSEFDLKNVKDGYPFTDAGDNSVRTLGSPSHFLNKDGTQQGIIKNSNLVFRAIKQVPPLEAIDEVETLELRFKGVRLNLNTDQSEVSLAKQVICVLDTKQCAGDPASDTAEEKANLNMNFWKSQGVVSTPEKPFEDISGFKVEYSLPDGSKTFVYSPNSANATQANGAIANAKVAAPVTTGNEELVINLKEVFGLKDKEAVKQWVMNNSTAYADGSYRKFQFVIGNNFYAQEGELRITFMTDAKKMPKDFAVQIGALTNGPSDLAKDPSESSAIEIKEKSTEASDGMSSTQASISNEVTQSIKSELFESNAGKMTVQGETKLKEIAARIKAAESSVAKIIVTGMGGADTLPGDRAMTVKGLLAMNGLNALLIEESQAPGTDNSVSIKVILGNKAGSLQTEAQLAQAAKELTESLNTILP